MGKPMDRSRRLFASEASFGDAFPQIEGGIIEFVEIGEGTDFIIGAPWPKQPTYSGRLQLVEAGGLMSCSNPYCNRGGYEIDSDIAEMVRDKCDVKEFSRLCPGDEGSEKGRRPGKKCLNSLRFRIKLRYRAGFGATT